jgi:TatD DNase family protein
MFATLCELRKETEEAIAGALLENTRSVFGITL